MLSIFTLDFMVRALIAGAITGLMAPTVGTYVVQRRLGLLGDGLGHVAIAGVGLALMTGSQPVPVAIVVCVLGSVFIEWLRQSGRASGDVGLAILFYGGLSAGVLMAGMAGRGGGSLSQYLFGSLTSVTTGDVVAIGVVGIIVTAVAIGCAPQLFAVCADEDFARTQGLRTQFYNMAIVVLAAVTVAVSMRTVGLMLVSALMVIPVATAQNLVTGFHRGLFTAMGLGLLEAVGGVGASYVLDSASGATIVVLAIVVFVVSLPISGWLQRRRRTASEEVDPDDEALFPRAEEHDECEGREGDQPAILHGDHVDYLHDGHRHAPHGDHFDEH